MSSIKRNILANYGSQLYVTVLGIAMTPFYLKYMGSEAYGLVGYFSMLTVWFNMLDVGLTPTMGRETARLYGGMIDAFSYRRLVRAMEGVFLLIALVGGTILFGTAGYIASDWLQATQLPFDDLKLALQLMAVIVAIRWMGSIYRAAIYGSEQMVWLGLYSALIATLRFVCVVPVLIFVGATPTIFFEYQFCVALLEAVGLLRHAYSSWPPFPKGSFLCWSWAPLRSVLKFSVSIALTTALGILATQTDRLALSKLLPLAEYGYFSLAVLVASCVILVCGPIAGPVMLRLVKLEAEGDRDRSIRLYRQATQLVTIIAGAATITLVFFSESLLWAWTGDKNMAHYAAPILILYSIGNGILSITAFPFYLQYAKGDIKLHLAAQVVFILFLVPSMIWAAINYGGVGTGYVWVASQAAYFFLWVPFAHRRFGFNLHKVWVLRDIAPIVGVSVVIGYALKIGLPETHDRLWQFIEIVMAGTLILIAATLSSSAFSEKAKIYRKKYTKY